MKLKLCFSYSITILWSKKIELTCSGLTNVNGQKWHLQKIDLYCIWNSFFNMEFITDNVCFELFTHFIAMNNNKADTVFKRRLSSKLGYLEIIVRKTSKIFWGRFYIFLFLSKCMKADNLGKTSLAERNLLDGLWSF